MDVIKTYIPKRYRNKKLINTGSGSGSTTLINSGNDISPSSFVDSDTFYSMFELVDLSGTPAIKAKHEFFSVAGVTAYGTGTVATGGGGSSVSVLDVLNSTDTGSALSANMGRVLNEGKLNRSEISSWALGAVKPAYGISEITGLSASLSGKSAVGHAHTISEISDFAHVHQWNDIENKPSVITNTTASFTTALETKLNGIATGANNYTHPATHDWSIIGGKPTNLSGYGITDAFKTLRIATDLDAVTESGIYRQETPNSGFNYTTTLNLSSADGRQQLTIARNGSAMKFRGVNSESGTTGWTVWNTVYHSGNFTPENYLQLTGGTLTGNVTAPTFIGALQGNADTATKLVNARTIAGTSFNGTANIDISYNNLTNLPSLAFLPLSGGTMTGNLTMGATTDIITNFKAWTKDSSKSLKSFLNKFDIDANGNLVVIGNLYSTGEVTAYSSGTGVSGLKLMGYMDANGNNIGGINVFMAASSEIGNVFIGNNLSYALSQYAHGIYSQDGEYIISAYEPNDGTFRYADNKMIVNNGQVSATSFNFGKYIFKEDASGNLGIYKTVSGVETKLATILSTRTNSNL